MNSRYADHSTFAIRAVFNPQSIEETRFKLPKDFFFDPAPWSLEEWREKLREYDECMSDRSVRGRAARGRELLLPIIKHIVGLPNEVQAQCLREILDVVSYDVRINLDPLLRIAHQIMRVPPPDQDALLFSLKKLAADTLTTRTFGKESFEALVQALGLDKPGPWLDVIMSYRHYAEYLDKVNVEGNANKGPRKRVFEEGKYSSDADPISPVHSASKRRRASAEHDQLAPPPGLDVNIAFAEIDQLLCNESNAFRCSTPRPTNMLPSAKSAVCSTTEQIIDFRVDMEAIDALIVEIDACVALQWQGDFDRYITGCGSHRERAETLTQLLKNFESLSTPDQSHYIEKLFDQMNDGTPVEFEHAYQLWLRLSALRQKNPAMQIAPDFGRAVLQWALTAHWTPVEFSAANAMLNG